MSTQTILLSASILYLVVFQLISYALSCDLKELALKYSDTETFSQKLGRFTVIHSMNVTILTIVYTMIISGISNIYSTKKVGIDTIGINEVPLLLLLSITILTIFVLPELEITDIDEIRSDYDDRSIIDEFRKGTSFDKHTRLCFLIISYPIPPIILRWLFEAVPETSVSLLLLVIAILSSSLGGYLIFRLLNGYFCELREELVESSPQFKQRFS